MNPFELTRVWLFWFVADFIRGATRSLRPESSGRFSVAKAQVCVVSVVCVLCVMGKAKALVYFLYVLWIIMPNV